MFQALTNDRQSAFLAQSIQLTSPKVRTVMAPINQRKYTNEYSLIVNGVRMEVCRTTICSVFGITPERIKTIKKKLEAGEVSPSDQRGKHSNHKTIDEAVRQHIRDHINQFPLYESHYCRADAAPDRRYLEPGLTLTKMYSLFKQYQLENRLPSAQKWLYNDIFKREFRHLSLSTPKNDTCDQCDRFKAKLADATQDERLILERQRDAHHQNCKCSLTVS